MSSPVRYCGRDFRESDLEVIRHLTKTLPTRQAISIALCEQLGWYRPDGRTKDMSARVALLRMYKDGLIELPPPRGKNNNGNIPRYSSPSLELPFVFPDTLSALGGVELVLVDTKALSRYWRELISSYHYLGYVPFAGAQLRYLIKSASGTLGALGFAASAWTCAPRDSFIGWDSEARKANLHLIVGNARFLILPQVRIKNLASHVLSQATRCLAKDWQTAYGYQPVLLETFVETGRFTGASYRAANWIYVGQTKGRGKLDRCNQNALPVKDIYLYPLCRTYRQILTSTP